jgi:hypothetical protein
VLGIWRNAIVLCFGQTRKLDTLDYFLMQRVAELVGSALEPESREYTCRPLSDGCNRLTQQARQPLLRFKSGRCGSRRLGIGRVRWDRLGILDGLRSFELFHRSEFELIGFCCIASG